MAPLGASASPTTSCSSASAPWTRWSATGRLDRQPSPGPVWFERSFSFQLGPHLLRGRVDRVDRHPDGSYELIDYKTGKAKTELELREDMQLSLYQMGARESWRLETSAQSYYYVMTGEKVPVEHSEEELDRVRATVAEIADGILAPGLRADPVAGDLPLLRLPDHLPGGREVRATGRAVRAGLGAAAPAGSSGPSAGCRNRWKSRAIVSAEGSLLLRSVLGRPRPSRSRAARRRP